MKSNIEHLPEFFKYLSNLDNQLWGEILTTTSGRRSGTRNHNISLLDLVSDAQKRAAEISIDDFEELCSIAINSRMRIWGYIADGIFYIIWFDPEHEIYPTQKRHT